MPDSPYAVRAWEILTQFRDKLQAKQGAGGWLESAKEIRVGLHASEQAYQPVGIYVMPENDRWGRIETTAYMHVFRLKAIARVRTLAADASDTDSATRSLLRLVGGIIDTAKEEGDTGSLLGGKVSIIPDADGNEVPYNIIALEDGAFSYEAVVIVQVQFEV